MIAVQKNAREELRVERQDYCGHGLINFRAWYDDRTDEYRPCKRGIAFKAEVLPEVLDLLHGFIDQRRAA
ncbi:PC4/YdbC family ssDNA-binding protein [Rhodobacteraceae bacterium]|nr:PC4/YdbC family ssDNA-binding protein [Paracoccaceae bacterium]